MPTTKTVCTLNAVVLRQKIDKLGWSLGELSRQTGIDRSAVTRLMNATRHPRPDTLDRLANALGCDPSELVTIEQVVIPKPRQRQGQHRATLRAMAFMRYGLECACCGEAEYLFLTIDHVVPGVPDSGDPRGLYGWLYRNGYPAGFQTLCFNCNVAKRDLPACPHQPANGPRFVSNAARFRWGLKVDTLKAYGRVCACCQEANPHFLALDHVNGDGRAHRTALAGPGADGRGVGGYKFYRALRQLGYPNDPPLRVLCHNCNYAVHHGGCPHTWPKED